MGRRLRRRHCVALVVVACVVLAALGGVAHTLAEAAPDSLPGNCNPSPGELPDICPSLSTHETGHGKEPYLEVLSDGTRRYRFDAVLWNAGGAFELEGTGCTGGVCDDVIQRVWTDDGTPGGPSYELPVDGQLIIEVGDGHGHYHFRNAAQYEIVVPDGPSRIASKVGFCMYDTYSDPNGPPPAKFYPGSCALEGGSVTMGISRGWGDHYPAFLEHQWVVVAGLEAGDYTLRAEVNPGHEFTEANYANNVLETTRTIPGATASDSSTTTAANTTVNVELSGTVEGKTTKVIINGNEQPDATDELDFGIVDDPAHGRLSNITATSNTTARVTYTPDAGYTGPDSFRYRASDSRGLDSLTRTATVTTTPPPVTEPPPIAEPPTSELLGAAQPTVTLRRTTIVGTSRADTIKGTGRPEIINGHAGADVIYARGGRDLIRAGKGNDRVFAGGGQDTILAGRGADTVRARDNKPDTIKCGRGNDRVIADPFDDIDSNCETVLLPA